VAAWPQGVTTPDSGDVLEHQTGEVVAHFIDHVQRSHPSPLGFDHSGIIADIGWAAQASATLKRAVALPLDEESRATFSQAPPAPPPAPAFCSGPLE